MDGSKVKYVVDQNGKKKAIILDMASYTALVKRIEELEAALKIEQTGGFTFINAGNSGRSGISVRHDEALTEEED